MKTLDEYLAEKKTEGVTETDFGNLVGLSQPYINRLRRGEVKPSWETISKIQEATGGVVPAASFFPEAAA